MGDRYGVELSIWLGLVFSLSLSVLAIIWFLREKARAAA